MVRLRPQFLPVRGTRIALQSLAALEFREYGGLSVSYCWHDETIKQRSAILFLPRAGRRMNGGYADEAPNLEFATRSE